MIKSLFNIFKSKEEIKIYDKGFENVEWAFQFNDDEPCLLAGANNKETSLTIRIRNKENSIITFSDGKGNDFKIFARERVFKEVQVPKITGLSVFSE
jgi:hypothetical protein